MKQDVNLSADEELRHVGDWKQDLTVQLLAAANPIGLDLIIPAIPQLSASLPEIRSSDLFSYYLFGMAVGQVFSAIVLQRSRSKLVAWIACLLYPLSALSAFCLDNDVLLLASRFTSGLSAGALYLLCFLVISSQARQSTIAALYAKRSVALLVLSGIVPVVSAGAVIAFEWQAVFLLQAVYGILCLLVVPKFTAGQQEQFTRPAAPAAASSRLRDVLNIGAMICFSVTLYTCLSNMPEMLLSYGHTNSLTLSGAVLGLAACYQCGVYTRKLARAVSEALFPVIVCVLLCTAWIAVVTGAKLDLVLYLGVYLVAGLYQSAQASAVLSRPVFRKPFAIGILTAASLLTSTFAIEIGHRCFADLRTGLWSTVLVAVFIILIVNLTDRFFSRITMPVN